MVRLYRQRVHWQHAYGQRAHGRRARGIIPFIITYVCKVCIYV